MSSSEEFVNAILELEEEKALKIARERLEAGEDPLKILDDLKVAAEKVGEKYEKGEFFVADLVMAGEIMKGVSELVRPKLKELGKAREPVGKLVIGTVEGDIHDIGKNIAVTMAEAAGFEVSDLGVDVPPQKFVEAIKQHNPEVVGMSGLLTLAIESMKKTVDAIKEAGLRDKVKIIIGGGRVDEYAKEYLGADAWTNDAAKGIRIMLGWVGGKKV
ncbi:MAG TPA: cobalamin-binding protein [Candidatus Bathyarchaeota archaeon]|nr:cobalamin-binding protein [Candidatus Bathyarchaeota archaeon]HEX69054.1 cobalamin-binding protein [Candidatus Bathyarchaeota archaeon]